MPVGMDTGLKQTAEDDNCNVCVAVKLRPLVPSEVEQGSRESLLVTPGMPQVNTGQHNFTYDHVFGGDCGSDPCQLYATCVAPLVDGLFRGYNATVFAYGQTGSGKTYTMGSEYRPGGSRVAGVIPEAISAIFCKIASIKDWQCSVRVSFVEIHKEEVRDLLVTTPGPRAAVSIREVLGGGVCLYGAVEKEVRSQDEMAAVLEMGTLCRATASTSMNNRSSRSHAIFTITLEQRRQVAGPGTPAAGTPQTTGQDDDDDDDGDVGPGDGEDALDDYLCAKMHLVDLAGSERAKRTKAEGARLKEGIHINRGLLALGNVINAIVDQHKHVPYRDSKLTRLLQDSLGGNSRTVMIACVSPADINFEESLNTLRYADRARHIRNKPIINRDPVAAQVAFLRQQIAALRSENISLKAALAADGKTLTEEVGGPVGGQHWAIVEQLQQENTSLELENTRLKMKVEDIGRELESVKDRCYLLQASLDRVNTEMQLLRGGPSSTGSTGQNQGDAEGGAAANAHDMVMTTYVARIAELEKELRAARQFGSMRRRLTSQNSSQLQNINELLPTTPPAAGMQTPPPGGLSQGADSCMSPTPGTAEGPEEGGEGEQEEGPEAAEEEMYYAEMAAHALEQEKMKSELVALQRLLESKERRMAELQVGSGQVPALKQHYDRVLAALQKERDELMAEKITIVQKLQHLQSSSEEERKRLESTYKEKLAAMDDKLRNLRHKEREFVSMQKLKQRTEDMCRRLSSDITRIKQQKVALQKTMEASAKQFAVWRQDREKELMQLRKQARRSAAQIQALEALQAKQNAVLQRKISDANAARKKLRELQEMSAKTMAAANGHASREASRGSVDTLPPSTAADVQPNSNAPVLRSEKARREWVEKELDMCNQSYEYRRVLEGELAQRAEANRQLRNITKRLMMVNNLTPASPLLPGPAGLVTPGPAQVGDAVVLQLNERKGALERQLADHNTQITELQRAWERAKAEEEGRGGGAADAKRFAGLRSVAEARELLRMVFHAASDLKAMYEDSTIEGKKLGEENELLRVQLDAARKEAEMHRKRAAVHTATAVTLACTTGGSTPFGRSLSMHSNGAGPAAARAVAAETEERDTQEYANLIQDLRVHATASKAANHASDAAARVGSIDGSVEVSVDRNISSLNASLGVSSQEAAAAAAQLGKLSIVKQLDTQSFDQEPTVTFGPVTIAGAGGASQPKGRRNARNEQAVGQQPGPQQFGRYTGEASHSDSDEGEATEEESEEDNDDSDDEMEDVSWDPSQATPARGLVQNRGGAQRRSSGRLARGESGSGAVGPSNTSGTASGRQAAPGRSRRRRSGSVNGSMTATDVASTQQQQWEVAVLQDVNRTRLSRGQPTAEKLTVQLMKECLKDRFMPDGRPWKAGSKTRDQLLADYAAILGLSSRTNSQTGQVLTDAMQQQLSVRTSGSERHQQCTTPPSPSPLVQTGQYVNMARSRDYKAALESPARSPTLSPTQNMALSNGASPSHMQAGMVNGSQLRLAVPQQHDLDQAMGVENAGAMTPLSLLYIQKAQEARMRMVDMRQHMGRGSSNTPLAGAQSPMSPSAFAHQSVQGWPAGLPAQQTGHMRHSFSLQHSAQHMGGDTSMAAVDALGRAPASMPGFSGSSLGAAAFHAVINSVVAQQQQPKSSPGSRGSTPTEKAGGSTQRGPGSRASGSPLSSGRRPGVWR